MFINVQRKHFVCILALLWYFFMRPNKMTLFAILCMISWTTDFERSFCSYIIKLVLSIKALIQDDMPISCTRHLCSSKKEDNNSHIVASIQNDR